MEEVPATAASGRLLWIELDEFGREAVSVGAAFHGLSVDDFLAWAARHCVASLGSGRIAWQVPPFCCEGLQPLRVTLQLPDEKWLALEAEAACQAVSLERLIHHASICLAADLDRALPDAPWGLPDSLRRVFGPGRGRELHIGV